MSAVGHAANRMIDEVRRQSREIKGLQEGESGIKPEYAKCVAGRATFLFRPGPPSGWIRPGCRRNPGSF